MNGDALDPLVERARQGDEEAFTRLVDEFHDDLCAFVAVRTSHPDPIEELIDDALATAIETLSTYRGEGSFRSWVEGIAHTLVLRHLDRAQRAAEPAAETLEVALARAFRARATADETLADEVKASTDRRCGPTAPGLPGWRPAAADRERNPTRRGRRRERLRVIAARLAFPRI